MSRTKKGQKPPGWETWSKRPHSCMPPGRKTKQLTNRSERRQRKTLTRKELEKKDDE